MTDPTHDDYLAEYGRLYRRHITDDAAFLARLAACRSADIIETLLAERIRRLQVELDAWVRARATGDHHDG